MLDWFKDKELSFSFALVISIAKGGIVLNYLISNPIYFFTGSLSLVFWVGTIISALSLIITIGAVIMDKNREQSCISTVIIFREN